MLHISQRNGKITNLLVIVTPVVVLILWILCHIGGGYQLYRETLLSLQGRSEAGGRMFLQKATRVQGMHLHNH